MATLLADATDGDGPLYRLVADALKRSIDKGEIPLGTVLPPERSLARSLSVSRATIVAAYERLKSDGWLQSRQGSGTWVRRPESGSPLDTDAVATARLFLSEDGHEQRSGPGEATIPESRLIDLSVAALIGTPTINKVMSSLTTEEISELTNHHGYVPRGLRSLRERVTERYAVAQLPTDPDQVLITTGAHQAISLVARHLLQPGDTVLVESPTFPGALDVFRRFGARIVPLPVDENGVRTDVLPDLVARTQPSLIYVTPHFHNPTGAVLPLERRQEIARISIDSDVAVLEDLALADIVLDDIEVPPPIASLAPEAPIHTIGSTSKVFWAGLRVGWLRSPESWSVRMLATKTVADLGSSLIPQLIAVKLIDEIDQILGERRRDLLPRRDLVCGLLDELLPDFTYQRPPGGLSIWATIPEGNAEELAELATRHGVAVVPGPALSVDEGNRRSLRLSFARSESTLEQGIHRLARAWRSYAPNGAQPAARLLI